MKNLVDEGNKFLNNFEKQIMLLQLEPLHELADKHSSYLKRTYLIKSCIDICDAPEEVLIRDTRVPRPSFNNDLLSDIRNPFL